MMSDSRRDGKDGSRDRLERDVQADPMLREGPATSGRLWTLVLGIAIILALVLYGVLSHRRSRAPANAQNTHTSMAATIPQELMRALSGPSVWLEQPLPPLN